MLSYAIPDNVTNIPALNVNYLIIFRCFITFCIFSVSIFYGVAEKNSPQKLYRLLNYKWNAFSN